MFLHYVIHEPVFKNLHIFFDYLFPHNISETCARALITSPPRKFAKASLLVLLMIGNWKVKRLQWPLAVWYSY